jgi:predicted Zn-dependent peptidase
MGSVESIQRIDFADLQFARDRLFSADNASVAISGNFPSDLGFRAVRRYFGAWLKSDKRSPNTFRQPDEPDAAPIALLIDGVPHTSVFGLRGLSKSDPDYSASLFLERILGARFQKSDPKSEVMFSARTLPGIVPAAGRSASRHTPDDQDNERRILASSDEAKRTSKVVRADSKLSRES